jgi:hypothetical protein
MYKMEIFFLSQQKKKLDEYWLVRLWLVFDDYWLIGIKLDTTEFTTFTLADKLFVLDYDDDIPKGLLCTKTNEKEF